MNDINQSLILALVTIPTLFGVFRLPKEMAVATTAIALALAFANLDKFVKFKGAGFEAELRTVVDKAYAAIDQLKDLGLSLSAPIVDELALSGRMLQYMPLKYKLQRVEKISTTLKALGASQDEIDKACKTIFDRVGIDHVRRIIWSLKSANADKDGTIFAGIDDGKFDNFRSEQIELLVKSNVLKKDPEVEERFLDLDHFLKTRKLRREDDWQS
jgi:hypothetical protein